MASGSGTTEHTTSSTRTPPTRTPWVTTSSLTGLRPSLMKFSTKILLTTSTQRSPESPVVAVAAVRVVVVVGLPRRLSQLARALTRRSVARLARVSVSSAGTSPTNLKTRTQVSLGQSETRRHAAPAGPSQQLARWKSCSTKSTLERSSQTTPRSSSWIALIKSFRMNFTMAAKEVQSRPSETG